MFIPSLVALACVLISLFACAYVSLPVPAHKILTHLHIHLQLWASNSSCEQWWDQKTETQAGASQKGRSRVRAWQK